MTNWIEPIALWLADFYLAATILLAAAVVLLAVIKQPARRMAVAWGTLCGLLLAAVLCQSASRPRLALRQYLSSREGKVAEVQTSEIPQPSAPIVMPVDRARDDEPDRLNSDVFEPPQMPVEQPAQLASPSVTSVRSDPDQATRGQRAITGIVWFFLAGSLLMGIWLSVGVLRAFRLVRQSEPTSDICLAVLHAIIGPAARAPRLRINGRLLMPVATGALQPAILLPEEFARSSRALELKAVLAHEWAHIGNGDLWLLALDRLVLTVLWAHPFYWWTRRRIRTDQEFLADAAAASQTGAADYAQLLVEWARKLAAHRGLTALTAVGIWERPAALEQRVTALLSHSDGSLVRPAGRTRLGIAAAMATLSLFAGTLSLRPPQRVLADAQPQPVASTKSASDESSPNTPEPIQTTESRPTSSGVSGACRDKEGKPLAGVTVSLYAMQTATGRRQLLREATTDRAGQFSLPDCLRPKTVQLSWGICDADGAAFELFAHKPGLATDVKTITERDELLDFTLTKAASLTGVVRDPEGKPIVDAWLHVGISPSPRNGWLCARSDRQGRFAIADLPENQFKRVDSWWPPLGILTIEHPAYGSALVSFTKVPGEVNVVLKKAAAIEGTVVDANSGRPAAGISVTANWIDEPYPYMSCRMPIATTDKQGRYRLFPLPEGQFNLCASLEPVDKVFSDSTPKELVATSVDSFQSRAGQSSTAPPIRLMKGGFVKGRLVQYRPGVNGVRDPVHLDPGVRLMLIALRGPALPGPGAVTDAEFVKEDGTFEMRLPPGLHYLQLPNYPRADGTYRFPYADMGEPSTEEDAARPLNGIHKVKIKEGETTEIEISVWRAPTSLPKPKQSRAKNEKPISVAAAHSPTIVDYHVNKDEIGGLCIERGEKRVAGIDVSLYLDRFGGPDNPDRSLLDRTTSNAEGQFVFRHVPELRPHAERFLLIARKQGRQTAIEQLDHRHDWIDLGVPPAVPLKGSVKDQDGRPIAGALVRCDQRGFYGLPETIRSARTNARGEFEIDDVAGVGTCVIEHPQYARRTLFRTKAGALAEVRLVKAGVIEGQIVDSQTGQPARGLLVGTQVVNRPYKGDLSDLDDAAFFFGKAKTDANGRYRIGEIPVGTFNVYLTSTVPGRASVAVDSLQVVGGKATQAPPIRLVKEGVVKGRLIDSATGKPAVVAEDEWVSIGVYGPSRPHSGGSIQTAQVMQDGSFEIRLPPGKSSLYLSGGPFYVIDPNNRYTNQYKREIDVREGQEYMVDFRVIRMTPMKKPASSDQTQPQLAPSKRSENAAAPAANKTSSAKFKEDVRYATLLLNVEMSELQKAIEANRQHPNTVPDSEIQKLRLTTMHNRLRRDFLEAELKRIP